MTNNPLIFDIAGGSFVDGEGIRTVVFFKGCPLSCMWCHNPESRSPDKEIFFYPEKCTGCGNCRTEKTCYAEAKKEIGVYYAPGELLDIISEDMTYYETSGGGITLSGGEPLSFPEYLNMILPALRERNISVAAQTCGFFDFDKCSELVFPYIDRIYFDFKIMDKELHEKYTGKSNVAIFDNFKKLTDLDINIIPRMVLIPGITATDANLKLLAGFFARNKIKKCEFLAYNPSGIGKLIALGKKVPEELPAIPLSHEKQTEYIGFFKDQYGICIKNTADFSAI